jgi:hypothetical protein
MLAQGQIENFPFRLTPAEDARCHEQNVDLFDATARLSKISVLQTMYY